MAITFEVYNNGGWVDLSNYVIASGKIPYLQRNRDYETIAPVFNCTISQSTSSLLKDEQVRIKSGATVFFSGHILAIKSDSARRIWKVQIASALYKLINYNCNYETLHDDISANGNNYNDYAPSDADAEGYPNIGVLYLLERMFLIAGLTLDISGIEDDVMFAETFQSVVYDVLMKDIAVDEQALYAVNSGGLEITFLDFIKKFLSITGLFIQITDDLSFILYNSSVGEIYTISDSNKYDYSSEEVTAKNINYKFIQKFGSVVDDDYRIVYNTGGDTTSPETQREIGEGNELVSWFDNLFFMVRNKRNPTITNAWHSAGVVTIETSGMSSMDPGDFVIIEGATGMTDLNGQWEVLAVHDPDDFTIALTTGQSYNADSAAWKYAGFVYLNYHITHSAFLLKRIREITADYTEEKIKTAIELTVKGVVENSIELKNQTSNIIQESY